MSVNAAREAAAPVRIELYGDLVASLRRFDPEDLLSHTFGLPDIGEAMAVNRDDKTHVISENLDLIDRLVTMSDDVINYINQQNIPGIEELQADISGGEGRTRSQRSHPD